MDLVNIRDLYREQKEYLEKEVMIGGWLRSKRDSKSFGFLVINDGTFFEPLQVVYSDQLSNFEAISKLNVGAALIVKGVVTPTPQAKQPFEIQATEVVIEGQSAPDYPLQKKRHTFEYLRTISHLRPRTNTFEAVFRVRSLIAYAIHRILPGTAILCMCIHHLSQEATVRAPGEMFQVTTMDLEQCTEKGRRQY